MTNLQTYYKDLHRISAAFEAVFNVLIDCATKPNYIHPTSRPITMSGVSPTSTNSIKKMEYGQPVPRLRDKFTALTCSQVRLGKSGLKVSRIILGCMSYGTGFDWTLSEKESIEQIKTAYALGVNVSIPLRYPATSNLLSSDVRHCEPLLRWPVRNYPRQSPQRDQRPTRGFRHHD